MKNICRKLLAVALSAVMLCLSSTQMVFADTIEMKNNRIDFIERDVTDTAAYLKYYMTINEKTTLVTEYVQIKNGSIIVDTSEIEVDRNSNINELSRNDSYVIYPIIDTVANSEKGVISRSGCNWKSHTATFSLRGAQFTAASVGAVLAAATGMGLPAAINAGAAMISFLIGIGYSSIPSDVYFKGKRCVSKSTGKIYYRYKGSIYKDSSHTQAMVKNLSWSRRWGH